MSTHPRRGLSLERKLPLLVTIIMVALLASLMVLSYFTLTRAAERDAARRIGRAVRELSELAGAALQQRLDRLATVGRSSAVTQVLAEASRAPTVSAAQVPWYADTSRAAAMRPRLLSAVGAINELHPTELWSADGRLVTWVGPYVPLDSTMGTSGGHPVRRPGLLTSIRPDSAHIGNFYPRDGRTYEWAVAPVYAGGRLLGYVADRRRISSDPDAPQTLRELTGEDVSMYLRDDMGVWTTTTGVPATGSRGRDSTSSGLFTTRPRLGRLLTAEARIKTAPWTAVAEVPLRSVHTRARSTVSVLLSTGIALTLVAVAVVWIVSRRMTHPLNTLAQAAERIAAGEYHRRSSDTVVARGDEIGRLAQSFDVMAQSVEREMLERRQAESALRTADRRKDEFLATLAHELRNPLASISNAVSLLQHREATSPAVRRERELIERQMQHLTRLVDDLLDISRITYDRIELHRHTVAISDLVGAAVQAMRPTIEHRRHTLEISLPAEPVFVNGDAVRLTQVFTNLLGNSAKYTEPGGHISVSLRREGNDVGVRITDTGRGIAPGDLPHVFEMFYRADGSATDTGGLGVGLSLVHRLIALHGGRVDVASDGIGKGCMFTVWLPLVTPSPSSATPQDGAGSPDDPSVASPPRRRVLIVDDNIDAVDSLALLIQLAGHEVETALDGQSGIEVAERFRPDVVLMDLGMPVLDGYEACRRIREQPWGRRIMMIAQTGWGQQSDRQRTVEAGFDVHLVKPVEVAVLLRMIDALASRRREGEVVQTEGA